MRRKRKETKGRGGNPGRSSARTGRASALRTSSRNKSEGDELLEEQRRAWRAEKARGRSPEDGRRENGSPVVKSDHRDTDRDEAARSVPALPGGDGNAAPERTAEDRDREALDALLEQAGFTTVDRMDADDFALMREAKLEALAQLCEDLKENKEARGKARLSTEALSRIARQLAAMERSKLEAVQLKIGKASDRPKRGVTFRARIGVQQADPETGKRAAGAALEVEVEEK